MATKLCKNCRQIKDTNEFYRRPTAKDGLRSWCKKCDLAWKHSEKGYESAHRYKASNKGRQADRRYKQSHWTQHYDKTKKYRELHPKENKARGAVTRAVRDGKLPKIATLQCNYPDCDKQAEEYHHCKGYEKEHWLDVVPYCAKHHRVIDSLSPTAINPTANI